MLERIIENWLDKATERSFEQPFCYMLSAEGHTIVHPTRHCGMELGKDIITIAPDGTPCAFQLKSGNISLAKWRQDVNPKLDDLVVGRINHPSVDRSIQHRSYLVTNGRIEEEVCRAIDDRNRGWKDVHPDFGLKTVVRGEFLQKAKKLGTDLWPTELTDIKTLLEMFLEDGRGVLPKPKLASLFESTFPLSSQNIDEPLSQKRCERLIASVAILCAIATSSYVNKNNHVAEIEAWTLYIAYVFAFAERWGLCAKVYENEFEIATQSIYNSLANLCDEIKERKYLVEGDPLSDTHVYKLHVTWLLGLMSVYALWKGSKNQAKDEVDDFIGEFCMEKRHLLDLWGEAAIPQFLALFWYMCKIDASKEPELFLHSLIASICKKNGSTGDDPLASPYYAAEDILPHIHGFAEEPLMDSFNGLSYSLEGLVHIYVRRNRMQAMTSLWPNVTRLMYQSFEPENLCDFYRWRNEEGKNRTESPTLTEEWEGLRALASDSDGERIPPAIKKLPILVLLFLFVYPHRMNAEILRWLDAQMEQIQIPK